jgi:hypothetical protein
MHIDSVRLLKAEIKQDILGITDQPAFGIHTSHIESHIDGMPRLGIGIASTERPDQFKLALRLESAEDLSTPQVTRILALARGEIDLQVTGPIAVLEPAHLEAQQSSPSALRMGSTVGVEGGVGVGTAGVFVRQRGSTDICILSNNHVLANSNQVSIGSRVFHYGNADLGWVGKLTAFHPIRGGRARNEVDCAIAKLDPTYPVDVSALTGGGQFSGVQSRLNHLSMAVSKVGRTTGRTHGYVTATELDTWVGFGGALGSVHFVNQIEIRGRNNATQFSQSGDSGSLVMDRDHNAFGLLFASSRVRDITYCNDIGKVLTALNIELLNGR